MTTEFLSRSPPSDETKADTPLGATYALQESCPEMLHCKGVVYSRLPYDTLWECTPLISDESDSTICSNADWVTVGAVLIALSSGTIREEGKKVKLIQQVPNLDREYAVDTLTDLAMQWVGHGSDAQRTPRVLLRRIPDNTWCFPSGHHVLHDVGIDTHIPTPHDVVTLTKLVTKQTGLRTSHAEWSHIETVEDTAGNLGISTIIDIMPDHPVIQNVYCKEILAATPVRSRSTKPKPITAKSDDEEPTDDISTVCTEDSEEPYTLRYVTSVLFRSTESMQNNKGQDSTQLGSHVTHRYKWVPLRRYISALRNGFVYRSTVNHDAIELMSWQHHDLDCSIWFAETLVKDLFRENKSRWILLVQPESYTTWCLPWHRWFDNHIPDPEVAYVQSVQTYIPNMEIPTNEVTAWQYLTCERSVKRNDVTEVTPCSYEWNGVVESANPKALPDEPFGNIDETTVDRPPSTYTSAYVPDWATQLLKRAEESRVATAERDQLIHTQLYAMKAYVDASVHTQMNSMKTYVDTLHAHHVAELKDLKDNITLVNKSLEDLVSVAATAERNRLVHTQISLHYRLTYELLKSYVDTTVADLRASVKESHNTELEELKDHISLINKFLKEFRASASASNLDSPVKEEDVPDDGSELSRRMVPKTESKADLSNSLMSWVTNDKVLTFFRNADRC